VAAIPLNEFHSTTTSLQLHGLPLGSKVSPLLSTEADCNNSSSEAKELGTLHPTLYQPFALFTLFPNQFTQLGRNPHRRSVLGVVQPFD
jgi:hypothetical protein